MRAVCLISGRRFVAGVRFREKKMTVKTFDLNIVRVARENPRTSRSDEVISKMAASLLSLGLLSHGLGAPRPIPKTYRIHFTFALRNQGLKFGLLFRQRRLGERTRRHGWESWGGRGVHE